MEALFKNCASFTFRVVVWSKKPKRPFLEGAPHSLDPPFLLFSPLSSIPHPERKVIITKWESSGVESVIRLHDRNGQPRERAVGVTGP